MQDAQSVLAAHAVKKPGLSPLGYLMIKSIRINNFRCFKKVETSPLSLVNVLVGGNGAGKTTFLESIFLTCGRSPELAWRLRNFRGMGTQVEVSTDGLEAGWKDLFNDFDQRKSIDIEIDATDRQSQRLVIARRGSEQVRVPLRGQRQPTVLTSTVEFSWDGEDGTQFRSRPTVSGDKVEFEQARGPLRVIFIPANHRLNPEEAAKRLSTLSLINQSKDLVDVLSVVYDRLEDLSVENDGGSWEVFAKLKDIEQRLPLALYSSGANRLVSIVLAIASCTKGAVLIDEIENGFYFKTLPEIWRVLHSVAQSFRCQLFVTTHSEECLKALAPVADANDEEFALVNIVGTPKGSRITVSTGEEMAAAIESGFEVRIAQIPDESI